jgi:hypothetical protein
LTQSGILQAANADLRSTGSGNSLNLSTFNNNFSGQVRIRSDGDASLLDNGPLIIGNGGASIVAGNLTLSSAGAFSQTQAITVSGTGTSSISTTVGGVTFSQNISLLNGNLTVAPATTFTQSGGTLSLGTGTLAISSTGLVQQTGGNMVVAGTVTVNSGGAAITLTSATNDFQGAVTLTGGGVWVQDVRHYSGGFLPADSKQVVSDKPGADTVAIYKAFLAAPAERTDPQKESLRTHYLATVDASSLPLAAKLDALMAEDDAMRARGGITLVMEEKKGTAPFAHVLTRGEYSQLGELVPAATPAVLPPMPADAPLNRLTLARWLVDPKNPLTARVTVNRVWQNFFGTGLVESSGDFGVTGTRPTHPELLDWLAVDFRDSGWDYRRLVRQLVMTSTYRQSAAVSPALLERDPANVLLARGPRYRLDAEQLRDQVLAASGLLVTKLGGRPVRPYQPEGIWEEVAMKQSTTRFYKQDVGDALYRRSLYTIQKRTDRKSVV